MYTLSAAIDIRLKEATIYLFMHQNIGGLDNASLLQ